MRMTVLAVAAALLVGACGEAGGTRPSSTVTPGGPSMTDIPGQPSPTEIGDLPTPTTGKPGPPYTRAPGTKPPATTFPGRTTLTGTPYPGVEAGCLLLQGYLLIGGPPQVLRAGTPVRVTGRPDPSLSTTCQQGIPFMVESAEPA